MRFLRRGGQDEDLGTRIAAFWTWWAGAKGGLDADLAAGRLPGRVDEIGRRVSAIHPKLAWEMAPGRVARHMFVVSPEGNPEVRPVALAWAAAAPPPDATWEYHPSRQAGEPGVIGVGPARVDLAGVRATTGWDEDAELLSVRLWHPAFDGLPDPVRHQVAFLFLDNLLGEDDVERWIGAIETDPAAAGGLSRDALRDLVAGHAAAATGERWIIAEVQDGRGGRVILRLNRALKRIDHPDAGHHLAATVERGLDQLAGSPELAVVETAEDQLVDALKRVAVEAARLTERRRRTTHFVCADAARAVDVARAWADAHRQLGASATVEADPRWDFRSPWTG
jgi:hypothetical protein